MLIDFDKKILNLNGKKILQNSDKGIPEPLNAVRIASDALMRFEDKEKADEKLKKFNLGMKINKDIIVDLKAEEIVLLKETIGKHYAPVVVGRMYEILENEDVKKDDKSKGSEGDNK